MVSSLIRLFDSNMSTCPLIFPCVYIYIYVFVYIYIYLYLYIYINTHTHTHIYIYILTISRCSNAHVSTLNALTICPDLILDRPVLDHVKPLHSVVEHGWISILTVIINHHALMFVNVEPSVSSINMDEW